MVRVVFRVRERKRGRVDPRKTASCSDGSGSRATTSNDPPVDVLIANRQIVDMSFTWVIIVSVRDGSVGRHIIADTIAKLMYANLLEVFNQRDHAPRGATIARIYADNVRSTDDDGIIIGRDALDAKP
jgi:hypothetical protein